MLQRAISLFDLDFSARNHEQRAPIAVNRLSKPVHVDFFVSETPTKGCICRGKKIGAKTVKTQWHCEDYCKQ